MAVVKFNRDYRDIELKRLVRAGEEVDMTIKRADSIVKSIKNQSTTNKIYKDYKDFNYKRVDKSKE
mgnify:CR=1 FL=1